MKRIVLVTLAIAGLVFTACQREGVESSLSGEAITAQFSVSLPADMATKAISDGNGALRLTVRIYDASGTFLQDTSADRTANESGWSVNLSVVPGTYSFSFWASSPDSEAYSFDGRNVTVELFNLSMNSDVDDAFWAVVSNKVVTEAFSEKVTLTRPLAQVCLYSKDDTIDLSEADLNDSQKFTSSFRIEGIVPTTMNLLDGSMEDAKQWGFGGDASLKILEKDGTYGTLLAFIYILAPAESLTLSSVKYSATLKRITPAKDLASGTVSDVRIQRNKRTLLLSAPQPAPIPEPEAVNLGLPSGLLWASFNVGATKPEEPGNYYAWGETETKDSYNWANYKWCKGTSSSLTRYCTSDGSSYWKGEGDPDGKTTFKDYDYADDVARQLLGGTWRTPTKEEWQELLDKSTHTADNYYGPNGQSILLPNTGFQNAVGLNNADDGYYWSSSLQDQGMGNSSAAWFMDNHNPNLNTGGRSYGLAIRAVKMAEPEAVDLGLPSGLKWASFNLGATAPEEYGAYYAWGEITVKDEYSWDTYKWSANGESNDITRYCPNNTLGSEYWASGVPDSKTTFKDYDYADDAARQQLGGKWRMPTRQEWDELIDNTTRSWTTLNNVNGCLFTATNGSSSIFLPVAGYQFCYWSSSLYEASPDNAWEASFSSGGVAHIGSMSRNSGLSVRPVIE